MQYESVLIYSCPSLDHRLIASPSQFPHAPRPMK